MVWVQPRLLQAEEGETRASSFVPPCSQDEAVACEDQNRKLEVQLGISHKDDVLMLFLNILERAVDRKAAGCAQYQDSGCAVLSDHLSDRLRFLSAGSKESSFTSSAMEIHSAKPSNKRGSRRVIRLQWKRSSVISN